MESFGGVPAPRARSCSSRQAGTTVGDSFAPTTDGCLARLRVSGFCRFGDQERALSWAVPDCSWFSTAVFSGRRFGLSALQWDVASDVLLSPLITRMISVGFPPRCILTYFPGKMSSADILREIRQHNNRWINQISISFNYTRPSRLHDSRKSRCRVAFYLPNIGSRFGEQ